MTAPRAKQPITRRKFLEWLGIAAPGLILAQPPVKDQPPVVAEGKYRNPGEATTWARADCSRLLPSEQLQTRYLSIYNTPPQFRVMMLKALNFVLSSLGTRRQILPIAVVPGTDNTLVRVNLYSIGLKTTGWENLGLKGSGPIRSVKKVDSPDPYFHKVIRKNFIPRIEKVIKVTPYRWTDGRIYDWKRVIIEGEPIVKSELTHAPWIDPQTIIDLSLATGSDVPILRGDWFLVYGMLTPAYYELMGIKTLADFQRMVRYRGGDKDLAIRGVVSNSQEVAKHIRALQRTPTSLGFYWESFDYLTSLGPDDLLVNLLNEKRDAGEVIATGPNYLQKYVLVNGKDELIDFGDTNIVVDNTTPWKARTVWAGASCVMCHSSGMKDITDEVRLLSRPNVGLLVKKKKDFDRVVDLFSAPINKQIDNDKKLYSEMIRITTSAVDGKGLTPLQNATNFQGLFLKYIQTPITLEDVSWEVGESPEMVIAIISRTLNPHHTLTQLAKKRPVRRDQWEERGFSQLMSIITSLKARKK